MAKKRKKDKKEEEEEYEFVPPDFDEKEFLRKEIKDTRASLITIAIAVVFGIVAWGLGSISRSIVLPSLLLGVVGIILLKYLYQFLKVDVAHFQKKNWVGAAGTFFFTFLAVTVLMLNVPFLDLTDPTVDKVVVWVGSGTSTYGYEFKYNDTKKSFGWEALNSEWPDAVVHAGDSINITAHIADNGNLRVVEIAVVPTIGTYNPMTRSEDSRYEYSTAGDALNNQALSFYIRATDSAGNSVLFSPGVNIPFA